jgi:hypothetical protein
VACRPQPTGAAKCLCYLVENHEIPGAFRRTGAWLAYTSGESEIDEVYVRAVRRHARLGPEYQSPEVGVATTK